MMNKLINLTLGQMVLINSVVIIVFMTVNSFVCPDGLIGGDCIKQLDNRVFVFQMLANFLFAGYAVVGVLLSHLTSIVD